MSILEEGIYTYLSAQSSIVAICGSRIYPALLPQDPELPAAVFYNIGTYPVAVQSGKPTLARTRLQVDCYAVTIRQAKELANVIRDALESYVGLMGVHQVQAVFVLEHGIDDYDDVPNDFRITSEFELWHNIVA